VRIMLDTNVLISLFVFPTEYINRLKRNIVKHQIVICSYVVDETKDVIGRKFPNRLMDLDMFFQSFPFVMPYTPNHFDASDYPTIRDEFDLPILVSAIQEDVDILITGDKDFFDIEIEKPEILTPTEYLNLYG